MRKVFIGNGFKVEVEGTWGEGVSPGGNGCYYGKVSDLLRTEQSPSHQADIRL